jgi:hypothetical protein
MTPNKHLSGENCPNCTQSKGERFINKCFNVFNIDYNTQGILKFDNELRNNFRIDFIIQKDKTYLIEYNGIQHYHPVEHFGGEEKFKEQQLRDQLLRDFVKNHSDLYELLEIDYRYNKYTIIKKLLNFLKVPIDSDVNSKLGELLED